MTRFRFGQLLASRGPDLRRWPAAEREAAWRLLRRSGAARRRYLATVEADGLLEAEARDIDPVLRARLLAGARLGIEVTARESREFRVARYPQPVLRWSALAACALLGVSVGWFANAVPPAPTLLASVQLTPMTDLAP